MARARLRTLQRASHAALLCALLAACGERVEPAVIEAVTPGPLRLEVSAEGTLLSSKSTPLTVPGQGWGERRLLWMRDEGSAVAKGDVIARFGTERSHVDLAEALIELERNTLARAAKEGTLLNSQGQVTVDLAKVAVDLGIAQRYADADLSALARNEVLDAIEDVGYLDTKRTILRWKQAQSATRGKAEVAVLDAQRATLDTEAARHRGDLKALELRAPHAGVLMLAPDWSGEKPTIGSTMRAGMEFGRLPDIDALEVELSLPQLQAQGIKAGNAVELSPVGRPAERVRTKVSWVASAPKVMSRESPVKYLSFKAPVPADAARRYDWVPGQRLQADVILFEARQALSVPNVAIASEAGKHYVRVRGGAEFARRQVKLGARDGARAQVLSGLSAGDEVLLVEAGALDEDVTDPADAEAKDDATQQGAAGKNKADTAGAAP